MKYGKLIIRGPILDDSLVDFAGNHPLIDGIVIGEPLCQYRSNLNEFQIIPFFERARRRGLYVSYQTPVYTTGTNFHNIVALTDHLAQNQLVDDVRLQDLGLLHKFTEKLPDRVSLTWSIYGYQREFPGMDIPINQAQIDFLKKMGVSSFEITTAVAFSIYQKRYPLQFDAQLYHYKYDPISFSRTCVHSRLSGLKCNWTGEAPGLKSAPPCDRPLYLQDENKQGLRYIIEGHRIMEEQNPREYIALLNSNREYSALVIEGRNLHMVNESLRQLIEITNQPIY